MPPWLLQYEVDPGVFAEIEVISYNPGRPMQITGWGFGEADPCEPEEFDYRVTISGEPYDPTPKQEEEIETMIAEAFADDF